MGWDNPPIGICNVCGAPVARGDDHLFRQRFCRLKGCSGGIYKCPSGNILSHWNHM
jgi:hypothetical protein